MPQEFDRFPLSESQRNIWNLERAYPGTSINHISTTVKINGRLDFALLQESISDLLRRDATLRLRIVETAEGLFQYAAPYADEHFPVYDFSGASAAGLSHWEEVVTRESMPVLDAPLYRFLFFKTGENEGGVLLKTHHIISDGWSQVLLCNRVGQTYLDLLAGRAPSDEEIPAYRAHVENERRYLSSATHRRDAAWWRKTFSEGGFEPASFKDERGAAISPVGRRLSFDLPDVLNHEIRAFCMAERVAPFAVYCMALAIYLKRTGGAARFTLGVPIFNRYDYEEKRTTGMFVSTLPFLIEIDESWTFAAFNRALGERWYELLRHQRLPYEEISAIARAQDAGRERLFRVALSFQSSQILKSPDASVVFSGRWHYGGYQSEQLCIHLTNMMDGRSFSVDYDFLAQLFTAEEIERLHGHVVRILLEALAHPARPLSELSLLSLEEREFVLYTCNKTAAPIRYLNAWQAFEAVVDAYPGRTAVIAAGERTSYRALAARAADYHAALDARGVTPGALVAVSLEKGAELAAAQLGVLRAGAAFLLLPKSLPEGRLREILARGGAALLITDAPRGDVPCLAPQDASTAADVPAPCDTAPDALAYVVYTSGSTGTPKGVEIPHRALCNFAEAMPAYYSSGAVLSLCEIGFDAFLIESAAAFLSAQTVVYPSGAEQESPEALARLITGYGVGFLSLTPSRLAAYLAHPAFAAALRRVDRIVCGGEALSGELLRRLAPFTAAKVFNQYGPSETAVGVTCSEATDSAEITVGRPLRNCRAYILDDRMEPLPVGVYGNLYIGGACVGLGYRNAPELTAASFFESPFEENERLYQTGDLARRLPSGEIQLAGRRDGQLKLRGLRVEPDEVAARLLSYPGVTNAVCVAREAAGNPVLCAYYTAPDELPSHALRAYLADFLPYYMIPALVRRLDAIPLTANGKLDVRALPAPESGEAPRRTAAGTAEAVLGVLREVLKDPALSQDADYFLSGGDSLNAMQALTLLEARFGLRLRVADLYICRTAAALAALIDERRGTGSCAPRGEIPPAPAQDADPLSPTQANIFAQSHADPAGLAYNMPAALRLPADVDVPRLREALAALPRHEAMLRASFHLEAGRAVCRYAETVRLPLGAIDAPDYVSACAAFLRPFRLDTAPLFRAALWQDADGARWLLFDLHHIIGDGLSVPRLLAKLDALYGGRTPQASGIAFRDYAVYAAARGADEAALSYLKETLTPMPEPLLIPPDNPRPKAFDFRGGQYALSLDGATSDACEALASRLGLTPYMLYLAAFGVLAARLTGRRDFTVGTPVSVRDRAALADVCGPLITTLPLRLTVEGTAEAYLRAVRERVTALLDCGDTSPEDVIRALGLPRAVGGNPLYGVLFSLRPDVSGLTFAGETLEGRAVPTHCAKLPFSLEAVKTASGWEFHFEYAASYYEEASIALYAGYFREILAGLTRGELLCGLDLLAPRDRQSLITRPWHLRTPFVDRPVGALIEDMARMTPDAPAVRFHSETYSYAALLSRAQTLAGLLRAHGARPGDRVALCVRRGFDLLAALLGILRAGCAYVPVLDTYPAPRVRYILENAEARLLLCDRACAMGTDGLPCPVVYTDEPAAPIAPDDRETGGLMYLLYTSGSTGRPKGVMLAHSALSNLLACVEPLFPENGAVLCATNVIFDTFITESLLALACGRTVVMADEEEMLLPARMAALIEREGVRFMQLTPSRLGLCLASGAFCRAARGLDGMILVGEALSESLRDRFAAVTDAKLINMYGPTEAAVYVTAGVMRAGERVTIGRSLANCRIYVLDEERRPVPPGAEGELYLAGVCLAEGYAGRPDLTAEAFLPDPFFPGERMYKSGDMGRLRADGTFEYLGRRDGQIKLNGQRVETGEITGALVETGLASEAAVLPRRAPDGSVSLRAFVVPAREDVTAEALGAALASTLPRTLIPTDVRFVAALPRTPSGKTDLKALDTLAKAPQGVLSVQDADESSAGMAGAAAQESDGSALAETKAARAPETVQEPAFPKAAHGLTKPELMQKPENSETEPAFTGSVFARESHAKTAASPGAAQEQEPGFTSYEQGGASVPGVGFQTQAALPRSGAAPTSLPGAAPASLIDAAQTALSDAVPLSLPGATQMPPPGTVPASFADDAQIFLPCIAPKFPSDDATAAKPNAVPYDAAREAPSPAAAEPPRLSLLLSIWTAALGHAPEEATDFFAQGGTSLSALGVLSAYFEHGLRLTLDQFYENPTLAAQAALLGAVPDAETAPVTPSAPQSTAEPEEASGLPFRVEEFKVQRSGTCADPGETPDGPAAPQNAFPRHIPACSAAVRRPGAVFLTGATGFLGAHIARALALRGEPEIICLLRSGGAERLRAAFLHYFGEDFVRTHGARFRTVRGDVTKPFLGMDEETYGRTAARTGLVLHCAADVRHYAPEAESLSANVEGVRRVIAFARASEAGLAHVSTASVSGERFAAPGTREPAVFTELDFDIGQDWRENVYLRGKFLAEAEVLRAMEDGLPVRIFRVGRLVGRASDGMFQKNPRDNLFYHIVCILRALRAVPASVARLPADLTPVDTCAETVVELLDAPYTVAHVFEETPRSLAELARALMPDVEILPDAAFAARLAVLPAETRAVAVALYNRGLTGPAPVIVPDARLTHARLRERGVQWRAAPPDVLLKAFRPGGERGV